jgi:hypothetical protein
MNGWIKLHRVLKEKPIWNRSTAEQKVILITLLLMANHQDSEWEWMGQSFKVTPGQFATSIESVRYAAGKGISIQNVRSAINRFKKLQFLTEQPTKVGRLITICNWEDYQQEKTPTQHSNQQRGNKDLTPNNNDKKNKKEISIIFDEFRKAYPENKRGLQTELKLFLKKNKPEVVKLLLPALQKEIDYRNKLAQTKKFVPPWKHLSTWINQKCWEQEFPQIIGQTSQLITPAKGLKK